MNTQAMRVLGAGRAMQPRVITGRQHSRTLCGLPTQRTMIGFTTPEQDRKRQYHQNPLALSSAHHGIRALHGTPANQNAGLIAIGVGVAALGVRQVAVVVDQYQQRKAAADAEAAAQAGPDGAKDGEAAGEAAGGGWFKNMFNLSFKVGRRFYDGGFEDPMTKREAALILGIRESTPRDKIREAHRRLARANHPDMGGSPLIATKINEAKEKLMGA